MAHRKAGGSAKNLRDSNAQYLGIKISNGQPVSEGMVILRQRGTKYIPGKNVGTGKDHTLFALRNGIVSYIKRTKKNFTGKVKERNIVEVN